ncbi:uncharacterized protein FIBRA_05933 [Fibroporia radiculosa]|uniref:Autophagy-related protein 27 n=1 Tax=Fibroporia radiculosa TaxID=599839 RepID=J4IAZ8_9APHY|nr:uncharacterized protein FIBRA_05933 [Fibroporia radiculosa]CCM03786.1 predicted protein [Fibroporia radiculosa]
MTDGSRCPDADGMTASTAVRFICDTSVFGAGNPELVAQLPPDDGSACAFFVEWRTHVACPTHQKTGNIGFITVLAAIMGTVFMLYILVGTWYNRYVLELRGFDQIPRISFIPLGSIVSSVHSWIDRLRYGSSDGRGVGYRGLAEEEGMLSGPPGFLDEQDEEDPHEGDAQRSEDTSPVGIDSDGVIRL